MIPVLGVPVLARHELLGRMVETVDVPVDLFVVVDNGGCNGGPTVRGARNYWLPIPSNLGVASSWNLIIKSTPYAPWWMIANFDIEWPAGSLEQLAAISGPDRLVLSGGMPPWCAFTVGEQVVDQVGLFDEHFHPAYFEDNDYERRVRAAGLKVIYSDVPVVHHNSSTIAAGYERHNASTFVANSDYYAAKQATDDMGEGRWQLRRRRQLGWDRPC